MFFKREKILIRFTLGGTVSFDQVKENIHKRKRMHRRRVLYNDVYTHYPTFSCRPHGVNLCSSYSFTESLPVHNVNVSVSPCYHDYGYRRGISYIDYDYYPRIISKPILPLPPIVQTNVHNDIYYCYDDPDVVYEDDGGYAYKLSRSKVQLVDIVPKNNVRTARNDMVVSTYRPKLAPERIVLPRSTVVRHTSLPVYERQKPVRVVPLYHSANPDYIVTSRI